MSTTAAPRHSGELKVAGLPRRVSRFLDKYSIYVVFALLFLVLSFLSEDFFSLTNLINILSSESGRGVLAIGVGFIMIAKGIDLSLGTVAALASVVATSLVQDPTYNQRLFQNLGSVPVWVAVLAGLTVGLLIGAFNGAMIVFFNVPPFIATLGGMTIAKGAALMYTGGYTVPMLTNEFKQIGQSMVGPFPIIIIYFVVIAAISWVFLNKLRFGTNLYAIGGNKNAAVVAGINVKLNTMLAYILASVMAAFVGIFLSARSGAGSPQMANGYELDAIAAAVVGGVSTNGGIGKTSGIVIGILLLGVLNNGFLILGVSPYLQQVIKGLIICGAVAADSFKKAKKV